MLGGEEAGPLSVLCVWVASLSSSHGWDLGKVSLVCYSGERVGYFCLSSFLQRGPQ